MSFWLMPRPMTRCVPTESKYSELTLTMEAPMWGSGSPCTRMPVPQLLADADLSYAGDGVEAILDGAIERRQLRGGVARRLRVDVDDIAVGGFEVQVGVLELVETLREQAGTDQKHERHGSL